MYYTQDRQHFIIDKLVKTLSSTGVLVTGETERGLVDGWSSLKMVSQQIPIFKHFSLEHSIKPIWRDPVYEEN
jgi:chemotaxis methyl-accepting protein methylase